MINYEIRPGTTMQEAKRGYLQFILDRAQGNVSEAARILGIHRRTIYRMLKKETIQ